MKMTTATGIPKYIELIEAQQLFFIEDETWLKSGVLPDTTYRIAISITSNQALSLLTTILPIIKELQWPFRLIKNKTLHYKLNSGVLGEGEIGRVMELYAANNENAQSIIARLLPLTQTFSGPAVRGYVKISESLFLAPSVKYCNNNRPVKRKLLLNGKYLPLRVIHQSPKGDIRIAVKRKGLFLQLVVAKQGRLHMYDDETGRTVRDRLLWEQEVLKILSGNIKVPEELDFFDDDEGCYSIINFIPGYNFYHLVTKHFEAQRLTWATLPAERKRTLLSNYLQAVSLVQQMHNAGFIHRDVNLKNFILDAGGQMSVIDFELTYDLNRAKPGPPFTLGMAGFVSPEQRNLQSPSPTEDVYSLGALLFYILTTIHPINFENKPLDDMWCAMLNVKASAGLSKFVLSCMADYPNERPALIDVVSIVQSVIKEL